MFEIKDRPDSYWNDKRNIDNNIDILSIGLLEYKNAISNPYDLINKIEQLDKKIIENKNKTSLRSWSNWHYGYNKNNPSICFSKYVPEKKDINPKDYFYNEQKEISEILHSSIDKSIFKYFDVYPRAEKNVLSKEKFAKILKYSAGDKMPAHSDHGTTSRVISLILYLNDDYYGGEITFPYLNISIKPSAGSVLMFPSNFIYTHEVKEITDGYRYSFPVWFHNIERQMLPMSSKNPEGIWNKDDNSKK
jgi:hypothetical protein